MNMEVAFPGGKKTDVVYKGFTIKTDQSEHHGGEGQAPQPFDLFLASIGACSGYYVLSFCEKRGIPARDVKLTLHIDKNSETKMVEKIDIDILTPPDFPKKYEKALARAAEQCTVTKHLFDPPIIEVRTKAQ